MRFAYFLFLTTVAAAADFNFRAQSISTGIVGFSDVSVTDINSDGKPDILLLEANGGAWFRNPDWTRKVIFTPPAPAAQSSISPSAFAIGRVSRIRHMALGEPDGSGASQIAVYRQPTELPDPQKSAVLEPVPTPDLSWERTVVGSQPVTPSDLKLLWADLDGDGSEELIAGSTSFTVYKLDPRGKWKSTQLALQAKAQRLLAADLNADGKAELVSAGPSGVTILWNETQPDWVRHIVAEGYPNMTAIAADFTGDGRPDVISTDNQRRQTLLYPAPDWKPVVIHTNAVVIHSAAMDVDGDGDTDYVGCHYTPGFIFWLERPAEPLKGPWQIHVVDNAEQGGVDGIHGILTGDVDQDGTLDLIGNSAQPKGAFPDSLAWFRVPPDPRSARQWERYVFGRGDAPGLSHYHGFGDVNGDGRPDIASAAKVPPDGNWFAWWEQPSDLKDVWKKHIIATNQEGATNVSIIDVNGDGKADFLCSRGHGVGLVWYEAPDWTPHEINTTLRGPHSLAVGDIDGDGDPDAVTTAKDSFTTAWFENDGRGNFTTHHIHENQSSYDIRLIDMDGDGDLDIVNAGHDSLNVVWFENRMKRAPLKERRQPVARIP